MWPCNIGMPPEENNHSYGRIYPCGVSTSWESRSSFFPRMWSMKVYILLIARLANMLKLRLDSVSVWWLWGRGFWISDLDRSRATFLREGHGNLANYDSSSQWPVTLYVFPLQSGRVVPVPFFSKISQWLVVIKSFPPVLNCLVYLIWCHTVSRWKHIIWMISLFSLLIKCFPSFRNDCYLATWAY